MWNQVNGVYSKIKSIIQSSSDGIIMICYSQGTLYILYVLVLFYFDKNEYFQL